MAENDAPTTHGAEHHEDHADHGDHGKPKGKGKGKGKALSTQHIIAIAGILTVLISYLLYRRSKSSSATTSTSTTANGLGGQPADYGSGGGSGGGTSTGSTPFLPSSGGTANPTSTGRPTFLVSDIADEAIALRNGISMSDLRYAGADPFAGKGGDYEAPTGLQTYDPNADSNSVYLGLAGMLAPAGASKIEGDTRTQTEQGLQQLLGLPSTILAQAAPAVNGAAAPAPAAPAPAAATPAAAAPATPHAVVATHPATLSTTARSAPTSPAPAIRKAAPVAPAPHPSYTSGGAGGHLL